MPLDSHVGMLQHWYGKQVATVSTHFLKDPIQAACVSRGSDGRGGFCVAAAHFFSFSLFPIRFFTMRTFEREEKAKSRLHPPRMKNTQPDRLFFACMQVWEQKNHIHIQTVFSSSFPEMERLLAAPQTALAVVESGTVSDLSRREKNELFSLWRYVHNELWPYFQPGKNLLGQTDAWCKYNMPFTCRGISVLSRLARGIFHNHWSRYRDLILRPSKKWHKRLSFLVVVKKAEKRRRFLSTTRQSEAKAGIILQKSVNVKFSQFDTDIGRNEPRFYDFEECPLFLGGKTQKPILDTNIFFEWWPRKQQCNARKVSVYIYLTIFDHPNTLDQVGIIAGMECNIYWLLNSPIPLSFPSSSWFLSSNSLAKLSKRNFLFWGTALFGVLLAAVTKFIFFRMTDKSEVSSKQVLFSLLLSNFRLVPMLDGGGWHTSTWLSPETRTGYFYPPRCDGDHLTLWWCLLPNSFALATSTLNDGWAANETFTRMSWTGNVAFVGLSALARVLPSNGVSTREAPFVHTNPQTHLSLSIFPSCCQGQKDRILYMNVFNKSAECQSLSNTIRSSMAKKYSIQREVKTGIEIDNVASRTCLVKYKLTQEIHLRLFLCLRNKDLWSPSAAVFFDLDRRGDGGVGGGVGGGGGGGGSGTVAAGIRRVWVCGSVSTMDVELVHLPCTLRSFVPSFALFSRPFERHLLLPTQTRSIHPSIH